MLIFCSSAYVHVTGQRVYIPYDIMFVSACDNTKAMYRPCFYNWVVNIDPSADKTWSQTSRNHCSWTHMVENLANEFCSDQREAVTIGYAVFQLETMCCLGSGEVAFAHVVHLLLCYLGIYFQDFMAVAKHMVVFFWVSVVMKYSDVSEERAVLRMSVSVWLDAEIIWGGKNSVD